MGQQYLARAEEINILLQRAKSEKHLFFRQHRKNNRKKWWQLTGDARALGSILEGDTQYRDMFEKVILDNCDSLLDQLSFYIAELRSIETQSHLRNLFSPPKQPLLDSSFAVIEEIYDALTNAFTIGLRDNPRFLVLLALKEDTLAQAQKILSYAGYQEIVQARMETISRYVVAGRPLLAEIGTRRDPS